MAHDRFESAFEGLDPSGPPRARIVLPAPSGLSGRPGVLAVLDASFNPPTRAHQAALDGAIALSGAGEGLLLLSRANVDKGLFGAGLVQRLRMMAALAESDPRLSVGACSHARFVDKAAALLPLLSPGTDIRFVIGHDTLVRLFDARYYTDLRAELDALFRAASFVAANRAGAGPGEMRAYLDRPGVRPHRDRIRLLELPADLAAMSSSEVRARRAQGEAIDALVPPPVLRAIEALSLYR